MPRATDRFLEEIRTSHEVYTYVDLSSPTLESVRLTVTDGDVKVDRTAQVRRSCSLKCIDPTGELTPTGVGSVLTPYGTELRPYRGVRYADGTTEVYPLGVFRLAKSDIDDGNDADELSLEAYDLSRTVQRDKFKVPYTVAAGTNMVDAIKAILARTFPDLEYDAITTTMTITAPRLYDAGDDPWEACTELARSLGCELFFDAEGIVVIAPPHDADALPAPDFTYIEGENGCTMTELSLTYTDEPGHNGVIVVGESPGDEKPPVRGEAWDDDPASPTYRYGPYGEVPQFVTDSAVKTDEEAQAMARSMLSGHLGASSLISVKAVPNPSFEAGDVVEVKRQALGVSGLYGIDAFNIPLQSGALQELGLRQRKAADQ